MTYVSSTRLLGLQTQLYEPPVNTDPVFAVDAIRKDPVESEDVSYTLGGEIGGLDPADGTVTIR